MQASGPRGPDPVFGPVPQLPDGACSVIGRPAVSVAKQVIRPPTPSLELVVQFVWHDRDQDVAVR